MPTKGTPVRTVRIPDELWDAARAKAEAEGRKVGVVIVEALQRYITRPPRQQRRAD